MSEINIPDLKAAALAATPHPWFAHTVDSCSINPDQAYFLAGPQKRAMDHSTGFCKADAAFIAAANPATILALLERLQIAEDATSGRLLDKAYQLAGICMDWNLPEVEIDGEMVDTSDLREEFLAARKLTQES